MFNSNKDKRTIVYLLVGIVGLLVVAGSALGALWFVKGINNLPPKDIPSDIIKHLSSKEDLIKVSIPIPLTNVVSPLFIKGEARGQWFFEATFPITIVDWDGRIIAQHYAEAVLDPNDPDSTWMTTEFVPFESTIKFESPYKEGDPDFMRRGTIIFAKSNASGLPEYDDALEIPILYEALPLPIR